MDPVAWANALMIIINGLKGRVVQAITTCALGMICYIVYSTIQMGSFQQAMVVAFTSRETRIAQQAEEHKQEMSKDIAAYSYSVRIIQSALEDLLAGPSMNASRARVGIVHDGSVALITKQHLMKYDIVASASERGREVGPAVLNAPLSETLDYLSDVLADRCKYMEVASLTESDKKIRLQKSGITSFLVCPVWSEDAFIGFLWLSFDGPVDDDTKKGLDLTVARHTGSRREDWGGVFDAT